MKNSHEKFGEIVREHFATVQSREFKARLYDASHGEFGEASDDRGNPQSSKMKRAARAVAAVGSRLLGLLHFH